MKIFVDMDGVLADFVKGVEGPKFLNGPLDPNIYDFRKKELSDKGLFLELPVLPGTPALIKYIKDTGLYWEILTATGDVNRQRVAADKNFWIGKHIDPGVLVTCTIKGKHKAAYAREDHILIDDRADNINAWIQAGGIGILHKDAQDTIKKLKLIV